MCTQSVIWAETSLVFCRIPPIWCANLAHQIDSRAPLDTRGSSAGLPRAFRGPSWATLGGPELFRNHLGWDGPATHSKEQRKQQHLMHTRHCRKAVNPWVFLGSWFNTRQRKLKGISAIDTYGDSNPLQKRGRLNCNLTFLYTYGHRSSMTNEGSPSYRHTFYILMGIAILWEWRASQL